MVSRTAGLVTDADGGTQFMDEIGELPTDAQGCCSGFLQEGVGPTRRGGQRGLPCDVLLAPEADCGGRVEAKLAHVADELAA